MRAARLGFDVWVEDKTLYFDQPKSDVDSGVTLRYGDAKTATDKNAIFLKYFQPRMSSTGVVNAVTVRGWNPEKKEEIVGEAKAEPSKQGKTSADKPLAVLETRPRSRSIILSSARKKRKPSPRPSCARP